MDDDEDLAARDLGPMPRRRHSLTIHIAADEQAELISQIETVSSMIETARPAESFTVGLGGPTVDLDVTLDTDPTITGASFQADYAEWVQAASGAS